MSPTTARDRAPIERVTIPLVPRTTAGCCDLAVMYYGHYVGPLARLYFTNALPAVCFVYGIQRFVGGGLAAAIAVLLLFSKPLGMLTVAAVWRTTFGEPFDWRDSRKMREAAGRDPLGEATESMLTAAAGLALCGLVGVSIEDEFGTGWLVQLGPGAAIGFVALVTLLLTIRSAYAHHQNHRPSRRLRRGFLWGEGLRLLLALPCGMLFVEDYSVAATVVLLMLWLPFCIVIIITRSFKTEELTLADIDPELLVPDSEQRRRSVEKTGPSLMIVICGLILALLLIFGLDAVIRTLGGAGPMLGPLGETASAGFSGLGTTLSSIINNPAFGALLVAVGLFVYQLGRIAWFFIFLDSRIRFDCWDMELLLAREAKRLDFGDHEILGAADGRDQCRES